jgi:hypothetical protein
MGIGRHRHGRGEQHSSTASAQHRSSRMVVVVTPAWVSNAIEQEIEVNKRRPKVTQISALWSFPVWYMVR